MKFQCPVCDVPLEHQFPGGLSQWVCSTCLGRAMSVTVLRRKTNPKVVTQLWMQARSGGGTERPCPACAKPMAVVHGGGSSDDGLELDACTRCQLFWLDPGEFEEMPPSLAQQATHPEVAVKELPMEARLALMRAKMASIEESADQDMGHSVDGLLELVSGMLLMPIETDGEGPQRRSFPFVSVLVGLGLIAYGLFDSGMTLTSGLLPYLLMGYFVLAFGDNVEDVMGPGRYLVYLLVALGLCGGLAISVNEDPLVAVPVGGLLGAVSSVLAVYLFLYPRARLSLLVFFKWLDIFWRRLLCFRWRPGLRTVR